MSQHFVTTISIGGDYDDIERTETPGKATGVPQQRNYNSDLLSLGTGAAGVDRRHTKQATACRLTYEREYERKKYDTVQLTIPQVIKQYERLIAQKRFPGEEAIAKTPE